MENNAAIITTIPLSSLNELFGALAKAQDMMDCAYESSDNPFFKSRYASFSEIVRASRPSLTANGLAVLQRVITLADGSMLLHTVLGHTSGQYIDSTMRINPPKADVQGIGSYITYLKRYSYAALVGVCTANEDDDGEGAMARTQQQKQSNGNDASASGVITKGQLESLLKMLDMLEDGDVLEKNMLAFNKIGSLSDMNQDQYQKALAYLKKALHE